MGTVKKSVSPEQKVIGLRNLRKILELMRHGSEDVGTLFGLFWREQKKYKLTLREIGTNHRELRELGKLGDGLFIKQGLCLLRASSNMTVIFYSQVKSALKDSGLTLQSLGSSRQELKEIVLRNFTSRMQNLLQQYSHDSFKQLLREAKSCGLKLSDLGVTWAEIARCKKQERSQYVKELGSELRRILKKQVEVNTDDDSTNTYYPERVQFLMGYKQAFKASYQELGISRKEVQAFFTRFKDFLPKE